MKLKVIAVFRPTAHGLTLFEGTNFALAHPGALEHGQNLLIACLSGLVLSGIFCAQNHYFVLFPRHSEATSLTSVNREHPSTQAASIYPLLLRSLLRPAGSNPNSTLRGVVYRCQAGSWFPNWAHGATASRILQKTVQVKDPGLGWIQV
jgi:hypothetical protein